MLPSTLLFIESLLGTTFIVAAVAKFGRTGRLQAFLNAGGLPVSVSKTIARLTPPLELVIGAALITGAGGLLVACAATIMSIAFAIVQVASHRRGGTFDCGCFGRLDPERVTWIGLGRALVVSAIAIALTIGIAGHNAYVWTALPSSVAAFSAGAAAAVSLIVSSALLAQVIGFQDRRPRVARWPRLGNAEPNEGGLVR